MGQHLQLHRALSRLGHASRREAAARIADGEVRVNGAVVCDPLVWVDLGVDRIELPLLARDDVYALHKPRGYVTSRVDDRGRATVYALLPDEPRARWLFPVGRLDRESEGVLLFTRDGILSHALIDPERHVEKRYRVRLHRPPTDDALARLAAGVELAGVRTRPAQLTREEGSSCLVVLREGRNRQIRRMFKQEGFHVDQLVRFSFGPVELGELPLGTGRWLDGGELAQLRAAVAG